MPKSKSGHPLKSEAKNENQAADSVLLQGFSLLDAVMFEWRAGALTWRDIDQAALLLTSRPDQVPAELSELCALLTPEGIQARKAALRALTWDGASYKVEYQVLRFDGQRIWLEEKGKRVAGEGKEASHIIGVVRDIDLQKSTEQRAAYLAHHDEVTGLWNKTRLIEDLAQTISASERYGREAAFLQLQITNLDDVNIAYGYEAGDRLLAGVAGRLKSSLRLPDFAARISADTFGVAICDCGAQEKQKLGEPKLEGQRQEGQNLGMQTFAAHMLALLSDRPYASPFGDLYGQFAIGSVKIPTQARRAYSALQYSKIALAHSRLPASGSQTQLAGGFAAYDPDLPPLDKTLPQSQMGEADILDALNMRRLTIAFQPIVHADTREPHHYECLLRLRREDGELVPAGEFIMAAERLNLVHLLDRRALEIASQTLRSVPDISLALNISAVTVKNDIAAADYIRALKALGADTSRIIIELTETVAIDDPARASQFSNAARALGCTFAIDDFGAGYTTFQNLMAIEADEIKIDGSFIRELSTTPHKQTFVRMIVDLAQTFSVKTVAEFVNTREDADLLTRLGVDYLQGYMFGVPSASPDWPSPTQSVDDTISAAQ